MPTHQSLSGSSDEDLLRRMIDTYPERFGQDFWAFFSGSVAPLLPENPTILDLGCGPALLLRDLGERYPRATLFGCDVTPAMIDYGRRLAYPGAKPALEVLDVTAQPLPRAAGTAHLVSMSSVLHVVDEPLPVLAEIRRLLANGGIFLLNDWVRQPLASYLAWRRTVMGEPEEVSRRRGFRLFPVHAKYTADDWHWLLSEAGLVVREETSHGHSHHIFVATPSTSLPARPRS